MVKLKHILLAGGILAGLGAVAYALTPKKYTFGADLALDVMVSPSYPGEVGWGDPTYKSPATGKLTKWRIKTSAPAKIRFFVLRQLTSDTYLCVARDERDPVPGVNEFDVDFPIQKNDILFIADATEQGYYYCLANPLREILLGPYRVFDFLVGNTYSRFSRRQGRTILINADVIGR